MSEIFTPHSGEQFTHPLPGLVLDTNTVLALWMFRDPTLEKLRDWIEGGHCRLYSREDALEELRRVLAYRQFGLNVQTQVELHDAYHYRLADSGKPRETPLPLPELFSSLPRCADPDDQKFVEIACIFRADYLLTRDRAVLRMARRILRLHSVSILRPDRFTCCRPNDLTAENEGQSP